MRRRLRSLMAVMDGAFHEIRLDLSPVAPIITIGWLAKRVATVVEFQPSSSWMLNAQTEAFSLRNVPTLHCPPKKRARPQSDCKRAQSKWIVAFRRWKLRFEMGRGPLWVWLSHASMASRGNSSLPTAYTWDIPTGGEVIYLAFPKTQKLGKFLCCKISVSIASIAKSVADSGEFALPSLKAQLLVFQLSSPSKRK